MIDTTPVSKPLPKNYIPDSTMPEKYSYSQISFRGVRTSKFRHIFGSPARKDNCYECIKITKNAHDSHFCAVNPKFVAVVTETAGGGAFLVIPVEKTGRVDINMGKIVGHRGPVLDLKWNPFNDNVIASCSDDGTIKLWYIPDGGINNINMTEPLMDLLGHRRRVSYIEWHPTAENILFSAGSDYLILAWNASKGEVALTINCHPDSIHSMSFNRDGTLLSTTCKDKKLRIIDPRKGQIIKEGICHQGSKASKVVFLGDTEKLFTTGFSRYNDRQWAVWSQHDLNKPLRIETIDSSSGVLFPYYDHDTKVVYIAGKGDGNIRYYEMVNDYPWCHYLNQFLTGFPQRGLGFMPKRGLDVMHCEIFRFYKLHATKGACEPISMIVPRKSEQFQDDLYPDTNAPTPALTAEEWLNGKNRNPILISMKTGAGARTHKPVVYKADQHRLLTSDRNNEKKFLFISQENNIDYRQYITLNSKNVLNVGNSLDSINQHHFVPINKSRLPWLQDSVDECSTNGVTVCDIVSSHTLPVATYVTIQDTDSASDPEMEPDGPKTELELRKAYKHQNLEIKSLKEAITTKDKKITELEEQLERLIEKYGQL